LREREKERVRERKREREREKKEREREKKERQREKERQTEKKKGERERERERRERERGEKEREREKQKQCFRGRNFPLTFDKNSSKMTTNAKKNKIGQKSSENLEIRLCQSSTSKSLKLQYGTNAISVPLSIPEILPFKHRAEL
jgi:ATP-dependent RNA helicase DDX46/PRP5